MPSNPLTTQSLVSPDRIFMLRKTEAFDPFPLELGQESASDYFKRRHDALFNDSVWRGNLRREEDPDEAAIRAINLELASIYGVEFKIYNE